eukprot:scaffold89072_cov38-Phaeocystis_antarctica.AAC.2
MALIKAAREGDLATLTRLVEERVNVNATTPVSAAPPAAPSPLRPSQPRPSPSALAAHRPCCPAHTAAADHVWRRCRASADRQDGPHMGGLQRQA